MSAPSTTTLITNFYPRPPRGGRRIRAIYPGSRLEISIHALREEGDATILGSFWRASDFYPRPPRGGRLDVHDRGNAQNLISIHALREEGDALTSGGERECRGFLSTPSARRATQRRCRPVWPFLDFYPRPPRGGRLSMHSMLPICGQFLSTPSARRATKGRAKVVRGAGISIHALREEGDQGRVGVVDGFDGFLSTPSARRATAKTETKSLFSNKLYNILHEFRRALIYNGSKSYPNHAK